MFTEISCTVDEQALKRRFDIPRVKVGIFKNNFLYSWKKNVVWLTIGSILISANERSRGYWRGVRVIDSFASVLKHTPLFTFVQDNFHHHGYDIVVSFLRSEDEKKRLKHLKNSCANQVRKGYGIMSMELRNTLRRMKEKGHGSYAVGTGQTIDEIRGDIW